MFAPLIFKFKELLIFCWDSLFWRAEIFSTHLLSWRCPKFEFLFLVLAGLASMFVIASWNGRYLRKFSGFQFWQDFEILVIFLVVVFAFISIYECTISTNWEKGKQSYQNSLNIQEINNIQNLHIKLKFLTNFGAACFSDRILIFLVGILLGKSDGIIFLQKFQQDFRSYSD